MGLALDRLEEERQAVVTLIAHLIDTDGFAEDIVYLNRRLAALARAVAVWRSERDGTVADLSAVRKARGILVEQLERWSSPALARPIGIARAGNAAMRSSQR